MLNEINQQKQNQQGAKLVAIVVYEANRIPQLNSQLNKLNKDRSQLNKDLSDIRIAIANTPTSDNNQLLRQMTGMANELDLKIADTTLQIQKHDSLQQLKNHM